MDVVNIDSVEPFRTKDGSEIRELLAHRNSCIRNQSLAEACVQVGGRTEPHIHQKAEEIYYILSGRGRMIVKGDAQYVEAGDAIAIPPRATHQIINTGDDSLRFLCCCAPGYEHEDTVLVD